MLVPVTLPKSTFTGSTYPQVDQGALVNCFVEPNGEEGEVRWMRAPGLVAAGAAENFRGFLFIPGALYVVSGIKVLKFSAAGGSYTELPGLVSGENPVIMARNDATVPQVVCVAPGNGVFLIENDTVIPYPDTDVGQPNSVATFKTFFIFGYADGSTKSSDVNATSIRTTSEAFTEYRPGVLHRVIPVGGVLMFFKSSSIEQWGGSVNDTGFPYSYMTALDRGVFGPYAVSGHGDGFGGGIYFVGDDCSVYSLSPLTKISPPDLDLLITKIKDKRSVEVMCFTARGHQFVAVQSPYWSWIFDLATQKWHQRKSYLSGRWRATQAILAFDKWLVGDVNGGINVIDPAARTECGEPMTVTIETSPSKTFPKNFRVNRIYLNVTTGIGKEPNAQVADVSAPGVEGQLDFSLPENSQYLALFGPGRVGEAIQPTSITLTDPTVEIQFCGDGRNWSAPRQRSLGRIGEARREVTANNFGRAMRDGARWRFTIHDPADATIMGAAMDVTELAS